MEKGALELCKRKRKADKNKVEEKGGEEKRRLKIQVIESKEHIKVDMSDPKAVLSEINSKSFWRWYNTGMKGPKNVPQRPMLEKKESRALRQKPLDLTGKHPVSALTELCQSRGWLSPNFSSEQAKGTGFLMKVEVNKICYTPSFTSGTKKMGKAAAAELCLQYMGLLTK